MHRSECLSACNIVFLVFTVGLYGCSGGGPSAGIDVKPTVSVTGKVVVDGESPETPIVVKAHMVNRDPGQPLSSGITDKDGVFKLNTYNQGDGIPPGEYRLTFLWGTLSMRGGMKGMDQLGGRYYFPEDSPFTVTVAETEDDLDLGVFELEKAEEPLLIQDDRY
jgi:hypothetical protein